MTADREELYRKLHDEAETSIERPQYRVLAHTLLNMFETLLDPKQAAMTSMTKSPLKTRSRAPRA